MEQEMYYAPSKSVNLLEQQNFKEFLGLSKKAMAGNREFLRGLWEEATEFDKIHALKGGLRLTLQQAGIEIPEALLLKAGFRKTNSGSNI